MDSAYICFSAAPGSLCSCPIAPASSRWQYSLFSNFQRKNAIFTGVWRLAMGQQITLAALPDSVPDLPRSSPLRADEVDFYRPGSKFAALSCPWMILGACEQ